jgi:hypothetical protein
MVNSLCDLPKVNSLPNLPLCSPYGRMLKNLTDIYKGKLPHYLKEISTIINFWFLKNSISERPAQLIS